jgi:hypothetical protein
MSPKMGPQIKTWKPCLQCGLEHTGKEDICFTCKRSNYSKFYRRRRHERLSYEHNQRKAM